MRTKVVGIIGALCGLLLLMVAVLKLHVAMPESPRGTTGSGSARVEPGIVTGSAATPSSGITQAPRAGTGNGMPQATAVTLARPVASTLLRRLKVIRTLEGTETIDASGTVTRQHLVETSGKYPALVLQQSFRPGRPAEPASLQKEVAYAADALLIQSPSDSAIERLVAEGQIRSYRKLARGAYRASLPKVTIDGVSRAMERLRLLAPGIGAAEPDYLVFTSEQPAEKSAAIDRDGDGIIDEEPLASMDVEPAGSTNVPTLSPEMVMKEVEQRLSTAPAGSRVLTFDAPLSNLRPQVGYRPYCMEQNFLLVAAPSQYASIYPQPPYNSGYPSNGTIYVRSLSGDSGMQLRHKDGLPFSIYQIDISEYSTSFQAKSVAFVGYRKDGTSITQEFPLDGIMDGTGPLNDFQTFAFNPGFTNLDRVVIPTEGFMMDNLVVAPLGEETPLPPPPASPTVYDITWDSPVHVLDQVTAVNGPYAPSTVVFGAPRVRNVIGAMTGPALVLQGTGAVYEQFSCDLAKNAAWYIVEFDFTMPSGGSFATLLDRNSGLVRMDFNANGTISSTFGASGTFTPASVTRIRYEVDLAAGSCKVFKNGTPFYSGSFPSKSVGGDIVDFRISATVSADQKIGIDNLRISADPTGGSTQTGPRSLITPLQVAFPATPVGMPVVRGVKVENTGSAELTIAGVRVNSPNFRTDSSAGVSLMPGAFTVIPVTYSPQSVGLHSGSLLFDTNETSGSAKTVALTGRATGVPILQLTPATLHVTMLRDDLGTEHFTIRNHGTEALQWQFITPPPTSRVDAVTPNDAQFQSLWGMKSPSAQSGGIDAVRAWGLAADSSRVRVAVIDTGVDYTHQDLAGSIATNLAETAGNGIDDDHNGFADDLRGWNFYADTNNVMDDHGHGTHVSGTIGATGQNGTGVTGIAWKASIVPIKTLNSQGFGYTSDAIAAVDYARVAGCRVINASWGGSGYSSLLRDAIEDFTTTQDGLFVAAAGNSFANIDEQPTFPASYGVDGIVAVAASDRSDNLAPFSNWGAGSVALAAPGVDILSCAPGNTYKVASGTSMATPHVSGSAALLLSYHPALNRTECARRLTGGADFPPGLTGKVSGGGRLNLYSALSSSVIPWIRPSIWSGSVPAGGSLEVPLSVDTHGLLPGSYTTSLALKTNDPAQASAAIPVTLKVLKRDSFQEWSAQKFAINSLLFDANAASTWSSSADPDQDGSSNLLEFLAGSDPQAASPPVASVSLDATAGRCFRYRTRSDLGATQCRVEWTSDITVPSWTATGVMTRLVGTDVTGGISYWEATVPNSDKLASLFFRIVAVEP